MVSGPKEEVDIRSRYSNRRCWFSKYSNMQNPFTVEDFYFLSDIESFASWRHLTYGWRGNASLDQRLQFITRYFYALKFTEIFHPNSKENVLWLAVLELDLLPALMRLLTHWLLSFVHVFNRFLFLDAKEISTFLSFFFSLQLSGISVRTHTQKTGLRRGDMGWRRSSQLSFRIPLVKKITQMMVAKNFCGK